MNNFFKFKQFTIYQDNCAMKVCTDACIFGAFITKNLKNNSTNYVLDIGAGTGLLSAMVAQKNNCTFDALEIDNEAYNQCSQNFLQSPWPQQLNAINIDVTIFEPNKQYDCIFSNPPFFEADLQSNNSKKNAAKHDTTLTLQKLIVVVKKFLIKEGIFFVLIPYHRLTYFLELALQEKLFVKEILLIKHTAKHPFFRAIICLQQEEITEPTLTNELYIKEMDGSYSFPFIHLLKDYYLHL
jgi:tRNA1Val (adenine37-N6)-methyltransferase